MADETVDLGVLEVAREEVSGEQLGVQYGEHTPVRGPAYYMGESGILNRP